MIKIIGNYAIRNQIGKGSFAEVHYCTDDKQRSFAAKIISIKGFDKLTQQSQDVLESVLSQEYDSLQLPLNINLVKIHDIFPSINNLYIIMEYCNGGNLKQRMVQIARFSEFEAWNILKQILNGYKTLYDNEIVHRDFKPQNIYIQTHGNETTYKIGDFGFIKKIKEMGPQETPTGSPLYMAPEMLQQKGSYDHKIDIYSIGIMFYELIEGITPFHKARSISQICDMVKEQEDKQQYPYKHCTLYMQQLINKMIKADPSKRISFPDLYQIVSQ